MSTIAVGIMVKNEAHIIERCLKSILPIANLVIITDTGSTDDTVMKAALFLQNNQVPFKIYKLEFENFGKNRNEVLRLAREESDMDYCFLIDADEILILPESFRHIKLNLTSNFYNIKMDCGSVIYDLPRLVSTKIDVAYEGVVHEYLNLKNYSGDTIEDVIIFQLNDGIRHVNKTKNKQEIEMMEKALCEDVPEYLKNRYYFYLGQNYLIKGDIIASKHYFNQRTRTQGWIEELAYTEYQLGNIEKNFLKSPRCLIHYHRSYELAPHRAEALFEICLYYLSKNKYNNFTKILIDKLINIPMPHNGLFIEKAKYGAVPELK